MVKFLLPFAFASLAVANSTAQTTCATSSIYGKWKESGHVVSKTYDKPPASINADSLCNALQ